jgi:tripartite-type tricarboxylate transporter receptor subunit TctC
MDTALRRRQALRLLAASALLPAGFRATSARAADINVAKIIVGYPPGASSDTICRKTAEALTGNYANSVIVENRPGASGRIAVDVVKQSPADGSVLSLVPNSVLTMQMYTGPVNYNPFTDLVPVTMACNYTFGMAVGPSVPASVQTLADWLAFAKAHPDSATYASPAQGLTPHFIGTRLAKFSGLELRHIGYRGIQPAMLALLAGEVSAYITPLGDFLPYVAEGKVRLIATSGESRSRFAPNVPTFVEQGFKEIVYTEGYGYYLPRGASKAVQDNAHRYLAAYIGSRPFVESMARIGLEADPTTPAELMRRIAAGNQRWKTLIEQTGFRADS